MVFSSLLFLFLFLPLFIELYYLAPQRYRNAVALFGSLLFYTWGEPLFAGILVVSCFIDYRLSLWLARLPPAAHRARRSVLTVGLAIDLSMLLYCKYSNFFIAQLNGTLAWLQRDSLLWTQVALPLGISFFTFQKISYLLDVYRGTTRPARSAADHLLFVTLFPQLIAGPIIRYHDVDRQIRVRGHSVDLFLSGVWRFLLGLGRKVLIANPLGEVVDRIFTQDISSLPLPYAWLGITCFAFQIYFDFAGYSDMAIGLGRIMGFEFIENFMCPYTSRSITEFWRRWHRSLSNFMRDYLYIPLGGNRVAPWRAKLNLWLVFLASGLWHGASWNFIVWGAFHGTLLFVEKQLGLKRLARIPTAIATPLTFALVTAGWVFFRADSLPGAFAYFARLTDWSSWSAAELDPQLPWPELISCRTWLALGLAAVVSFIPESWWQRGGWLAALPSGHGQAVMRIALAAACLLFATAMLTNQNFNPFIYFRF